MIINPARAINFPSSSALKGKNYITVEKKSKDANLK